MDKSNHVLFFCQGCCTCIYLDKCSLFNNTKHTGACILMLWLPEETEFSNKGVPLYLVNNNYSFEKNHSLIICSTQPAKLLFHELLFLIDLNWVSFFFNLMNWISLTFYWHMHIVCWLFTFKFLFYRDTASGGNTVSNFI